MYTVSEIAELLRREEPGGVVGLEPSEVQQVQAAWEMIRLPSAYEEFLTNMGSRAGRVLLGTDAFFPTILEMSEWADEFFEENASNLARPKDALVFAMHQGYLAYWMSDASISDPEVTLFMEGESKPMRVWPSFTAFLNSHYLDEPGVK
ncbi:SMI1/KNR4 family protein [Salinispora arenicola]|uniref:SMI1/KNR4 family protein n=1 Tax=Salinispora arenicola TaxID=168697 RepID=UPI0009B73409|nr:SMI1/KNR4 family protein [Salinispora arenicola]